MDTLVEALRFAVPLWIEQLRSCTADQRLARQVRAAKDLSHFGDALQFPARSPAARRTAARAFNSLAESLAAAAYLPGGSSFRDLSWCVADSARADGPATLGGVAPRPARYPIIAVQLPDVGEDTSCS